MLSRMRFPLKHALSQDSHARPFHTTCTHAPFHTTRTHTPFTRLARTTFNTTDAMLFFYGNIVMLSSSCDLSDRHMLWILSLPNEDFGRMNKRGNLDFRSTFQGREYSVWDTNQWKVSRKVGFPLLFILPKSSFGEHKFDRHIVMLHHAIIILWVRQTHRHVITNVTHALSHDGCYHCYAMRFFYGKIVMLSSSCDFMLPKRRFWKDEQKMTSGFSKHFSRVWVLDLGYEPLKINRKSKSHLFVHPSKIVVWGA
jgi:hypothetical protein